MMLEDLKIDGIISFEASKCRNVPAARNQLFGRDKRNKLSCKQRQLLGNDRSCHAVNSRITLGEILL
jgi:hypothetical protein